MKKLLLITLLALCALGVNANIVSADFINKANASDTPEMALVTRADEVIVSEEIELGVGAEVSNPQPWIGGIVYVDLDPYTNILTLKATNRGDFTSFSAALNNIVLSPGEWITGAIMMTNNLTIEHFDPAIQFTDHSLLIQYGPYPGTDARRSIFNLAGEATFQITTVPEPTSLALFGLALIGLGASRRRKS